MSLLELQSDQTALVAALGSSAVLELTELQAQRMDELSFRRGLRAYRVNAQAMAQRALAAVYRPLQVWLGTSSFEALAWAFWRSCPPQRGDLADWGAGLEDFLRAQPEMEALPCQLACLCWASHQAERAADGHLDADSLWLLTKQCPQRLGLQMRPGLSLQTASSAAMRLWQGGGGISELMDGNKSAEPVLVWRKAWVAQARCLAAGEHALLDVLLQGLDLSAGLQAALRVQPDFDFGLCLQFLLRDECLCSAYEIK